MTSDAATVTETAVRDQSRRRRAVPLLRQPREVPAVRHHDEREGGRRRPHRQRARSPQADTVRAARVRRRHGQRDRARQRAPRSAPPDADRAVRGGRQGGQHGGHPVDAVDAARSLLGAPRDRRRAHQHVLRGGARAVSPQRRRGAGPGHWWEVGLDGTTSYEFQQQVGQLENVLAEGWQTVTSPKTGNPVYDKPSVLVLYRKRPGLRARRPDPAQHRGPQDFKYDLVLAAQPYRSRTPAETKVKTVLAPIARALAPNGRLVVVQSTGSRPGDGDRAPHLAHRRTVRDTPGTR